MVLARQTWVQERVSGRPLRRRRSPTPSIAAVAVVVLVVAVLAPANAVDPCGPPNAADFGLRCTWEPQGVKGSTEAEGLAGAAAGAQEGLPPQCCCVSVGGTDAVGRDQRTRPPPIVGPLWNTTTATRCFPHAIIVGAQKGGTTALFAHFLMRPDFEAPAAKEVRRVGLIMMMSPSQALAIDPCVANA
jgi:hypothetical protein